MRCGRVATVRGLGAPSATRLGRFSPPEARLAAPSADPYDLARFVDAQRQFLAEGLRLLRGGGALRRRDVDIIKPLFPIRPIIAVKRTDHFDRLGHPEPHFTSEVMARDAWVLRDLPPNGMRGDRCAEAFLLFPTQPGGVNLRAGYLQLVAAATTAAKVAHTELATTTSQAFGTFAAGRVFVSAQAFADAARRIGDDEAAAQLAALLTEIDRDHQRYIPLL